ncbi:hypothetical protein B0T10DRAFT_194516 [Thelonectria olida]|uniref:BZIP domain-containing protein n=1 Tax=Thelonectria olida TaxID=1576542 RepID=A0A9P9AMD1_9HYPO|nr:hypothetical protein B0T10DRAFT_194516 [Thelonectria olida]
MADLSDAKSPPKRRGRPPAPSSSSVDEATLTARRQRNREAQNVFRRRKQAADAAQAKRLRRLEEVVEEMSSIFMNFVDEVLASEIVTHQPGLAASLRKCTRRVLDLAQEVVGPEGFEMASSSSSPLSSEVQPGATATPPPAAAAIIQSTTATQPQPPSTTTTPPDVVMDILGLSSSSSTSPPALSSTSSTHSSDKPIDCDLHLGSDAAHQSCHTARTLALPAPPGVTENIPEPITPTNESLIKHHTLHHLSPQIYGNGWSVNNHPVLGANVNQYWGPRVPLAPGSFAYRLAKASLTIAYLILSKNIHPPIPHSEEHRIFGKELCYRGRDDLLIRLRWLLGPGNEFMYRVVDLPYGQHGDQIFTRSDLDPTFDELGWPAITKARLDRDGSARYLSILGIEKQLLALGGRIVDAETLELNIVNPAGQPSNAAPSEAVPAQSDSWSFVDFYAPNQMRSEPQVLTMQLSIGLLVSNLAKSAVCLMRGPGYPRDSLGGAIQASVTKVS